MKHRYTVVLLPDVKEGGFVVAVPALPGCVTQAETIDEAIENAKDLIELYIEEANERGDYILVESAPATVTSVEVDVETEVESAAV